jgi:AcrR family transcriptional regulator
VTQRSSAAARPPGRPRSALADEAIIDAVLDLIAEGSTVETLSMEAVAARAGVGKATVYRRWPNKEALVMDAIAALKGGSGEAPGGTVRDDLVALLGRLQHPSTRAARIMPCLAPELHRNPGLYDRYIEWLEARREVFRDVLRRGIATGELDPDLDIELTLALLTGPMTLQSTLSWHPRLDPDGLPERVVDTVLKGIRGPNG